MLNEERNLFIWGKNYPTPTLVKGKVTIAAAGENHVLLRTCKKDFMKPMGRHSDSAPISSDSLA